MFKDQAKDSIFCLKIWIWLCFLYWILRQNYQHKIINTELSTQNYQHRKYVFLF